MKSNWLRLALGAALFGLSAFDASSQVTKYVRYSHEGKTA